MTTQLDEEWRPVVGYPNYLVSDYGRIYSKRRKITMKLYQDKRYLTVCIGRKTKMVHTLVAEAFLGPRPDGMVIRHLDGNAYNSALANLCYGTYAENEADKKLHGTRITGESIASSRLTAEQVKAIKAKHSDGVSARALGREYGVSHTNIRNIVNGVWWRDVS